MYYVSMITGMLTRICDKENKKIKQNSLNIIIFLNSKICGRCKDNAHNQISKK